jgi:hypothetical protein
LSGLRDALAWSALYALSGCTAFPVIDANVCGNGVLDSGAPAYEDCDTFVDQDATPGAVCRPPGVIGECRFGCQPNADGAPAPCPSGRGCAADGVCRFPSGKFEAPLQLSVAASSWVSTADFDGDDRADLISTELPDQVQQARFRLHYFDADADIAETRTFPHLATRPVVRRVDEDRQDDLVFSNFRVGMLPGRRDREWVPSTFSSYVIPSSDLRVVPVDSGFIGESTALVVFATLNGVAGLYVPPTDDAGLAYRAPLLHPLAELAGEPLATDVVEGIDSPCREVTFAFRGESSFSLFDMCELDSDGDQSALVWRKDPVEQVVRLPRGAEIDAGPLSADVDGDGHLDLLIGANGRAYLARGDGTRLEDTSSLLTLPILGEAALELPMPLATGDISGDGVADFVFPERILVSRKSLVDAGVQYSYSYVNNAQPWSVAHVVDLNGNGLSDVIAGTKGVPGLSFLSGTGRPFPVPARISTQGPLRFLATGDYDGDLIQDVALIESGPPQDPNDSLAIAFGNRDKVPLPPVRVAELSGVAQLGSQRDGGLDDVFTASIEVVNDTARAKYTLFGGDADRLPFAPYSLVGFSVDGSLESTNAAALVVGSFSPSGAIDAVALGTRDLRDDPWDLWLIPDVGGGEQPPRRLAGEPPPGVLPTVDPSGGALSVAGAAADLDGDGLDEALWLMPKGDGGCVLLVYHIDPVLYRAELQSQVELDEPCATPELSAAQLRQPKLTDLLLLMGDPKRGPRQLELLWNDGSGNFTAEQRSLVADARHGDVRAFSVFPGVGAGIAFVTDSALHIADDLQNLEQIQDVKRFHDARGVVVIDPNSDHVNDIVVADADGLWLIKASLR